MHGLRSSDLLLDERSILELQLFELSQTLSLPVLVFLRRLDGLVHVCLHVLSLLTLSKLLGLHLPLQVSLHLHSLLLFLPKNISSVCLSLNF